MTMSMISLQWNAHSQPREESRHQDIRTCVRSRGSRLNSVAARGGGGAYAPGRRPRGAPSGSRKIFFECSISSVNCYEFRGRVILSHSTEYSQLFHQ
jgi:hypothetical protein